MGLRVQFDRVIEVECRDIGTRAEHGTAHRSILIDLVLQIVGDVGQRIFGRPQIVFAGDDRSFLFHELPIDSERLHKPERVLTNDFTSSFG